MLQVDTLLVGKRMFGRQYRHQRLEPNRLDVECGVRSPWRMQQAEVELPNAHRLKPLFAVDVFQQYFNVRIRTSKAGDGVWDHVDGGHAHRAEHDASGLPSARTSSGVHRVRSVVQDDA